MKEANVPPCYLSYKIITSPFSNLDNKQWTPRTNCKISSLSVNNVTCHFQYLASSLPIEWIINQNCRIAKLFQIISNFSFVRKVQSWTFYGKAYQIFEYFETPQQTLVGLEDIFNTSSAQQFYVFNISSRRLAKTSWRRLEDILQDVLEDEKLVLKKEKLSPLKHLICRQMFMKMPISVGRCMKRKTVLGWVKEYIIKNFATCESLCNLKELYTSFKE